MEKRAIQTPISQESRTIGGYAATFGVVTEIRDVTGRQFREVLTPGAFGDWLDNEATNPKDCICCVNHDESQLLGRTRSKTLRLVEDDKGLQFECDLPNNSIGDNVAESIRRGDIDGMSFAFRVREDVWTREEDGVPLREIRSVELCDVSPVVYSAYPVGTSVDLRSLDAVNAKVPEQNRKTKLRKMKLELLSK